MMAYWSLDSDRIRSPVQRYGFAAACVAITLGLALALSHFGYRNAASPLLVLAVILAACCSRRTGWEGELVEASPPNVPPGENRNGKRAFGQC
jgi:hypothetical protein